MYIRRFSSALALLIASFSSICVAANSDLPIQSTHEDVPNSNRTFHRGSSGKIEQHFEGTTTMRDLLDSNSTHDTENRNKNNDNTAAAISSEENETVRRYVTLSQYIHSILQRNGYAQGILRNMKTAMPSKLHDSTMTSLILVLPVLEEEESSSESDHFCVGEDESAAHRNHSLSKFDSRCEDDDTYMAPREATEVEYEIVVDIDAKKYPAPHAVILEAYRLTQNQPERTKLTLFRELGISTKSDPVSFKSMLYSVHDLGGAVIVSLVLVAFVSLIGLLGVLWSPGARNKRRIPVDL